jgi:D-alanyl-D-alanine carboxypeptidase (penicillin-binding protein 5/6)
MNIAHYGLSKTNSSRKSSAREDFSRRDQQVLNARFKELLNQQFPLINGHNLSLGSQPLALPLRISRIAFEGERVKVFQQVQQAAEPRAQVQVQVLVQQALPKPRSKTTNPRLPRTLPQSPKEPAPEKKAPALNLRPLLVLKELEERVRAHSYVVMEPLTQRIFVSSRGQVSLEVASLTKIMTCVTVLDILARRGLDMSAQQHVISTLSERMSGTSAEILEGEVYSVEQLLYAMMLPSGNDAAVALAEWGGRVLRGGAEGERAEDVRAFIKEMNALAQQHQMRASRWANPHGLPHQMNKSTAYDMARLCSAAIQNPLFRRVVSTKHYRTEVSTLEGAQYPVEWENTNRLLNKEGFFGIKTGITSSAGPCLASSFAHGGREFVVVLLRTNKASRRFKETKLILGAVLRELAKDDGWKNTYKFFRTKKELD